MQQILLFIMSGIKEVNQFVTVTQVRKIVVESLSPLVNRLQIQLQKISQQTLQMRKQNQRTLKIEKTQNSIQNSLRQFSKSISEIKTDIIELNNEDKKTMLQCNVQLEKMKGQIQNLKRQYRKNDEKFIENNKKVDKITKEVSLQKQTVDQTIDKFRQKLQQIYSETLQLTKKNTIQYKRSSEKMDKMFYEIQRERQKYKDTTNILSMYQIQKEQMNKKIQRSLAKLHNTVTQEQFSVLSYQVEKYSSKANQMLVEMPNKKEMLQLKQLVLHIQDKVKDFTKVLQLQVEVESIKRNLDEQTTSKKGNHVAIQQILDKIQERLQQVKKKRLEQVQQAKKTTEQKITDLKQQIKTFKQQYQKKFIEAQSKNNFLEIFCEKFQKDLPERQQKLKKSIVDEIQDLSDTIHKRCGNIEFIATHLEENLASFGNKLTKIKSDNKILQDTLRKQSKELYKNQVLVQQNFKNIGKILSKLIQTQLITQSINLFNSIEDLKENLVFTTYNDGIICEIQKLQNGQDILLYRKRHLNFEAANRAILKGLVDMVDDIICNQQFLNWVRQRPSNFFIQHIYENYKITSNKSRGKSCKSNFLPENSSSKTLDLIPQVNKLTIGDFSVIHEDKNNSTRVQSAGIYRTISTAKNNRQTIKYSKQKSTISITNEQSKDKYYYTKTKNKENPNNNHDGKIFVSRSGRYSRISNIV